MSSKKNPIDRFVYGIRDGFKNIKKAFAESEVIHKCIKPFLPTNVYTKEISSIAVEITELLETKDITSTDKEFNLFYRIHQEANPNIENGMLMLVYIIHLTTEAFLSRKLKSPQDVQEFLQKPDSELNRKEKEILKEVLKKMQRLRDNISY